MNIVKKFFKRSKTLHSPTVFIYLPKFTDIYTKGDNCVDIKINLDGDLKIFMKDGEVKSYFNTPFLFQKYADKS